MLYEPREDSYLLSKVVSRLAYGRTIDVGTGSGIQALTAAQAGCDVCAVDINPDAVVYAKNAGVDAVESDMFSAVSGMFDTIICNAPYLPDEPLAPDVALDGGPRGFEWTLRFLSEAVQHLSRHGQILLLISSHTRPAIVEQWLVEHALVWEVVASEKISFEELLVYRIQFALPDHPEALFLAKGKRSRVYRDGSVAIKSADPRRIAQEARMLKQVNNLGLGPKFFEASENQLRMEFIDGVRIDQFLASASLQEARTVLSEILRQCTVLDDAGINKQEMTNPYKHALVQGDSVVMIDWERAKPALRTQNVAQFHEYIKHVSQRYDHLEGLNEFF